MYFYLMYGPRKQTIESRGRKVYSYIHMRKYAHVYPYTYTERQTNTGPETETSAGSGREKILKTLLRQTVVIAAQYGKQCFIFGK